MSVNKRSRSLSLSPVPASDHRSTLAGPSKVVHPHGSTIVGAHLVGDGPETDEEDYKLAGSLDSEDWDDMLEVDEYDEDDESGPNPEEARREREWVAYEERHRPSETEADEMSNFLKERGLLTFIKTYVIAQQTPIIRILLGFKVTMPRTLRDIEIPDSSLMPVLKMALSRARDRIESLNSWEQALALISSSKRILVLTGAGISVSCGIPDFRSPTGLYAKLKEEGKYDLDDPQQMFDIHYFKEHPDIFYSFASQIYPSNFIPSPCHRWIKLLEDKGKLLRNYTQNIDTLETQVGISSVLQCHGSFATASCLRCHRRVLGSSIEPEIMSHSIPYCKPCIEEEIRERKQREVERERKRKRKKVGVSGMGKGTGWGDMSSGEEEERFEAKRKRPPAIIKPDITFFGEALDDRFDRSLFTDREEVDLLLIIGSSLQVAPVSEVLAHLPHSIPQILINKTPVRHFQPDINLLGDADGIIQLISDRLGWELPGPPTPPLASSTIAPVPVSTSIHKPKASAEPERVGDSNVWLFDGADISSLIDPSRRLYAENESESENDDGEGVEEGEKQKEIGPSF